MEQIKVELIPNKMYHFLLSNEDEFDAKFVRSEIVFYNDLKGSQVYVVCLLDHNIMQTFELHRLISVTEIK